MKPTRVFFLALVFAIPFTSVTSACSGEDKFTVTASISNLQAAKDNGCVTDNSYIELLKVGVKGEENVKPQENPKAKLKADKIVLKAKSLQPGSYVLLAQSIGPSCQNFLGKENHSVSVVVPPDAKTPFRVDLGTVDMMIRR